jgi:site-specific recombinase XerC
MLPKDDTITVSEYLLNYMETVGKHTLRPRTVEAYTSLGKIRLSQLRPDHLQTFHSQRIEAGLSKRTVQFVHSVIRKALKQAVLWGMIHRNVCDLVQAPGPVKKAPVFFTKEQLNMFLA